jgi:hypothetical protein
MIRMYSDALTACGNQWLIRKGAEVSVKAIVNIKETTDHFPVFFLDHAFKSTVVIIDMTVHPASDALCNPIVREAGHDVNRPHNNSDRAAENVSGVHATRCTT